MSGKAVALRPFRAISLSLNGLLPPVASQMYSGRRREQMTAVFSDSTNATLALTLSWSRCSPNRHWVSLHSGGSRCAATRERIPQRPYNAYFLFLVKHLLNYSSFLISSSSGKSSLSRSWLDLYVATPIGFV